MARPRITYYIAMSIDGYIAAPDDDLSYLELAGGIGEDYGYAELMAEVDGIVMGANTLRYIEEHAEEWPYAGTRTWIMTHEDVDWGPDAPAMPFNGGVTSLVDTMAGEGVTNAWLVGGADVAGQFARASMIDRLILTRRGTTASCSSSTRPLRAKLTTRSAADVAE